MKINRQNYMILFVVLSITISLVACGHMLNSSEKTAPMDSTSIAPPMSGAAPQPMVGQAQAKREMSGPTNRIADGNVAYDVGGAPIEAELAMPAPPISSLAMSSVPPAPPMTPAPQVPIFNTEGYAPVKENEFLDVAQNPLSTFSIDVDTASYSNMRRYLANNQLPPRDSIRIEELVNYFSYDYPQPKEGQAFSVNVEVAECPWEPAHRLARIALKGKEIARDKRPPSNLVFLLDVSGSMDEENKLPLVKKAIGMLVQQLTENDSVSLVVYAGASGVVLPPTTGDKKSVIIDALNDLSAGGSTNAGEGLELAYKMAIEKFKPNGTNRVIIATDGDFNVGVTSHGDLYRLIEEKAKSKIFLTVLGFGMGNYKDDTLELLADKGNGNYGYIDTENEARKMLVSQMSGTLITIAKDVKIQIEFNPNYVTQYRLIGYENRLLKAEDFHDDKKDAGEIGAGHTVTVFYELVPVGVAKVTVGKVDPLKYQSNPQISAAGTESKELMTVKLRYKQPTSDTSDLIEMPVLDNSQNIERASPDFMFATSVVCFGMILQDSKYKGKLTMKFVEELAEEGKGNDIEGYREEFLKLVETASDLLAK